MHGDEGCAEDQQQDSNLDDVRCVPGRSEDPRRIPESGAQQINGGIGLSARCHRYRAEGPLIQSDIYWHRSDPIRPSPTFLHTTATSLQRPHLRDLAASRCESLSRSHSARFL